MEDVQQHESQKVSVKEKKSDFEDESSANQLVRGMKSDASGNEEFRHWGGSEEDDQ